VYVADFANHRIQKFDANGTFISQWGNPNEAFGHGSGDLAYPTGVGVDPDGNVWVADHTNQLVKKYDSNGKLLLTWPSGNTHPSARSWIRSATGRWRPMFLHPRDVAVDKAGNVYVLEFDRARVQKLDSSGKLITTFGTPTSKTKYPDANCWRRADCWNNAPGRFGMPRRIAIDNDGNVLVTDGHRIQKFSSAGSLLKGWGRRGSGKGQFGAPTGIAVGPDGKIFAVEEENNRLQTFDEKGAYLKRWGSRGRNNSQFQAPLGLAIGSGGGSSSIPPFITPNCEEDVTGSGAPVTTDARGSGGGTVLYLTQYSARDWTGDLKSYQIKDDGQPDNTTKWSAAAGLDGGGISGSTRVLLTWGKPNTNAKDPKTDSDGVAFQWDNLWAAQQSDLRIENDGSCGTVAIAEDRLAYLRGDESEKGFRKRKSLLGAIVHSRAIYVGDPILDWPDIDYAAFKAAHQDRDPVIYVGANDGALHGFSAKDGKEVIGYFPASLFDTGSSSGLHYFTNPDYKHHYLVDGSPAVSDAYIRTQLSGKREWRTVLVSTLRGGGRGLFAVDVTNPALFTEGNAKALVLWEFNSTHDAHLGYTFSEPTIARMNDGRWAAIIGNGYEDTADDKTGGQAQLFVIYLDGGVDGTWTEGKDYLRITTGTGSTGKRNGLATPAVLDLNGDATVDRVYAGDLEGNLWAFDLSSKLPVEWKVATGSKARPRPLFRAADDTGMVQPITVEPVVFRQQLAPAAPNPNVMVFFGTGKYILEEDKSSLAPQTFYGVWDRGDSNLTRSNLTPQKILFESTRPSGRGRVIDPNLEVDYLWLKKKHYGWYLDLPTPSERVVSDPKIRGNTVYFNTVIPDPEDCAFGGKGWMMSVMLFNGGSPPKDSPTFDFNEDGEITVADDTVEFRNERYAYAGKMFEKGGEPTGPSIVATGGRHLRYTAGTKTDEVEEIETSLLEKTKRLSGRISWQQMYPD
jgi:type IV pilus assembly protein PilY1